MPRSRRSRRGATSSSTSCSPTSTSGGRCASSNGSAGAGSSRRRAWTPPTRTTWRPSRRRRDATRSSTPPTHGSCRASSAGRSTPAPPTSTWRCRCRTRTRTIPTSRSARSSATRSSRTSGEWEARGQLALVGCGTEPGFSDVAARYAADHLFREVHEVGVRDGANLEVRGHSFAPTFSIWTTIEECLNPPVIWERDRGWYTTAPFSEPETFAFPAGIGDVECVNVEHEEVLLIPRWVDCDARHLQVRPRRRVHRRAADPAQARAGPDGSGERRRVGSALGTWWRRCCRTPPSSARR